MLLTKAEQVSDDGRAPPDYAPQAAISMRPLAGGFDAPESTA
jgi:hypothetical protein